MELLRVVAASAVELKTGVLPEPKRVRLIEIKLSLMHLVPFREYAVMHELQVLESPEQVAQGEVQAAVEPLLAPVLSRTRKKPD